MILDCQLNFKSHVKKLRKTIKANLTSFRIIRNCLKYDLAFLFLNSMILSHMAYGLSIWSQTNQCIINQVECLYNTALKVLDRKQIRSHHCQILSKFAHFSLCKVCVEMFKWTCSYALMYFLWDYMEAVDPLERLLVETVELYIVKHYLLRLLSQWKVYKI